MAPNRQLDTAGSKQPPCETSPGRQHDSFFDLGQLSPKQQLKWAGW
jgi:hypothetical protein